MPLIDIGDAELHTEITGSGPDLVLMSGLGGVASFWRNQVPALSEHFRVITFDARGTGKSTPSKIVYSTEQMAGDVIKLIDALGIAKAHFVGHSTGGGMAQVIAVNHKARVERLVLSAAWAGPTKLFIDMFAMRRQVLINCGPQAYFMVGTLLAVPARALHAQYAAGGDPILDRVKDFAGLEIELARIGAVMSHDMRSRVHAIDAPTLCIVARDDQMTPPPLSEELAQRINGAKLVVLEEGGHFAPAIAAAAYNRHLLEFLRG